MPDASAAAVEAVLVAVRESLAAAAAIRFAAAAATPFDAAAAPSRSDAAPLRVVVALSGGRDSMVLLDALARLTPELGIELSAAHVHHGLSTNADAWAAFCANECAARSVSLAVHRV